MNSSISVQLKINIKNPDRYKGYIKALNSDQFMNIYFFHLNAEP